MIQTPITAANSAKADATLAYFTQASVKATQSAAPASHAHAALDLMFGYYNQN